MKTIKMTDIKLNDKMNDTVKEMLQLRKDPMSLYALKRIEFLEGVVKSFVKTETGELPLKQFD